MGDLHFITSRNRTPVASRPGPLINLLAPELGEVYYHEMIKGIGEALHDSGCRLLLSTNSSPTQGQRVAWEQEQVALLKGGAVDGCLIITPTTASFPSNERIVVIDPHSDGGTIPSVVAANHAGALLAMEYLTGLGHRRIGFIGGSERTHSAVRRFEGYRDGLAAAGIAYDSELRSQPDQDLHFVAVLLPTSGTPGATVRLALGGRTHTLRVEAAPGGAALLRIAGGALTDAIVNGLNSFLGQAIAPRCQLDHAEFALDEPADIAWIGGERTALLPSGERRGL